MSIPLPYPYPFISSMIGVSTWLEQRRDHAAIDIRSVHSHGQVLMPMPCAMPLSMHAMIKMAIWCVVVPCMMRSITKNPHGRKRVHLYGCAHLWRMRPALGYAPPLPSYMQITTDSHIIYISMARMVWWYDNSMKQARNCYHI